MDGVSKVNVENVSALASMVAQPAQLNETLSVALRALSEVIPYDLAVLFELAGDALIARAAEGPLASDAVRAHRLVLDEQRAVREALQKRAPIAVLEEAHAHHGDPFDGVLDLEDGHACMVVPLFSGERALGLITLDRKQCTPYGAHDVALAGVYGSLVSLALVHAEQSILLARYKEQLEAENAILRRERRASGAAELLGRSKSAGMRSLLKDAERAAASDVPILISGATGAGKELLAAAVHEWSPRARGPFVTLNCAAIPSELVESELFGHKRGAFTGAERDRLGRFQAARGGTLFLDELGELPMGVQAKLLRVLQEKRLSMVGCDDEIDVDVRVIAATNVDLARAIEAGRFREDLYFRLAVFPLALPPLSERREDIPGIARAHLDELEQRGGGPWVLSPAAERALLARTWPGNVRELLNSVERATILCPRGTLEGDVFAPPPGAPGGVLADDFEAHQRAYFKDVLRRTQGRLSGDGGAAEITGLKTTTLQSKLKKLGIERAAFE